MALEFIVSEVGGQVLILPVGISFNALEDWTIYSERKCDDTLEDEESELDFDDMLSRGYHSLKYTSNDYYEVVVENKGKQENSFRIRCKTKSEAVSATKAIHLKIEEARIIERKNEIEMMLAKRGEAPGSSFDDSDDTDSFF